MFIYLYGIISKILHKIGMVPFSIIKKKNDKNESTHTIVSLSRIGLYILRHNLMN